MVELGIAEVVPARYVVSQLLLSLCLVLVLGLGLEIIVVTRLLLNQVLLFKVFKLVQVLKQDPVQS